MRMFKEGKTMQMCPSCDSVYDESEYTRCPYCSGELEHDDNDETRACRECNGVMHYDDDDDCWRCSNCGTEIEA